MACGKKRPDGKGKTRQCEETGDRGGTHGKVCVGGGEGRPGDRGGTHGKVCVGGGEGRPGDRGGTHGKVCVGDGRWRGETR